MTRRGVILAAIFILIVVLAFILRDVVDTAIILPAAYFWWLLKIYYAAFPQVIFWALLVAAAMYSAIVSLVPEMRPRAMFKPEAAPVQGHIEILADWLSKSQRGGTYHKWLIANRLGKNARELLAQRDGYGVSKKFGMLSGRGWNPPRDIEQYLNTGLNGSFANFPRAQWFWQSPPSTPWDIDPQQVIDYLEDEMETRHGRDRKSI